MCINKISLEAAARLASVFEVGIEDVLDPFEYLEGTTGYADKIKYKWIKDPENGMEILFTYKRRQIKDCIGKTLTNLRYRKIYEASAGMHIESFVEEQEFLEEVEKEIIGHGE